MVSAYSLRKTVGKASQILVTLTSRSDSDVESSNVSLKENKPDFVPLNPVNFLSFHASAFLSVYTKSTVSVICFSPLTRNDGVNPNSNDISTTTFEKMKEKFYGFRQTAHGINDIPKIRNFDLQKNRYVRGEWGEK